MKEVGGGEGDDPEAGDQAADGKDPSACGAVVGGEGGCFTDAEKLASEADGHQ